MSNSFDATTVERRRPLRISTDVPLCATSSSDSWSSSSSYGNYSFSVSGSTPNVGNPQSLHVVCMHDFESSDPAHLSFHKDEVLIIVKQEHSGWWAAMRPQGDRIGWIPSSFVLPLDRGKMRGYSEETRWPNGSSNDTFLFVAHDPWIRVSEDNRTSSLQRLMPTDVFLFKGFSDDRVENHGYELFFNLSNDDRSYDMEDVCVLPTTPGNPPPHRAQISHFPTTPLLPEPAALQTCRPTSPGPPDTALCYVSHPRGADDRMSLLRLTIPISPDEIVPELISGSDAEESFAVLGPLAASRDVIDSEVCNHSQPITPSFRLARRDRRILDMQLLDLTWSSDSLAEQLCVLMHTHYANIRRNDCFDWIKRRRSTGVTGLRYFFDTHDQIAWWVRESVLAYDHVAQQAEALDMWIRVAEKCRALRNFDSLCAIILALSESSLSSLRSAWVRCSRKQAFERLLDVLDMANRFRHLIDIMDIAKGPSVPFVRKYLERIKELHVECPSNSRCQLRHGVDVGSSATLRRMQFAAVSALLRHQSLSYGFKTDKSIHEFINDLRIV